MAILAIFFPIRCVDNEVDGSMTTMAEKMMKIIFQSYQLCLSHWLIVPTSRLIAWIMFLQYLHDQVIVATSQVFSLRPSVRAPFLRRENALLKDCRS